MLKQSSGILLYRLTDQGPEFLLVHPGGPFWSKKDTGAWSIPKGEITQGEDPLVAAKREFHEETGHPITGDLTRLTPIKQKGGKVVYCYACEGDIDPVNIKSNTFEMEWPPRSGKRSTFPEVDKAMWFDVNSARTKILEAQVSFIDELFEILRLQKDSGKRG